MGSPPSLTRIPSGKPILPVTPKRALLHNVDHVVLGNLRIKPWYPSFYSEEIIDSSAKEVYVCHDCFKYTKEIKKYFGHLRVCPCRYEGPPGTMIYENGSHAFHEIDGDEHKPFTQNLSLFAKFFLDTKSVFYDVGSFLYYLLVLTLPSVFPDQPPQRRVIGFFSKEKMSWDNNNLACIVVFPPWQRQGYGQALIGCSYELSRREGRLGGPEKPLSELGRKGYLAFWSATIARYVLNLPPKKHLTVRTISEETWLLPDDIISAFKEMKVLDIKGGGSVVLSKAKLRAWVNEHRVNLTPPIDETRFVEWLSPGPDGDDDMMEE